MVCISMTNRPRSARYRCPNVPPEIPDGLAFCNYQECRGCSDQRRIRLGSMPEPTVSFDDHAMDAAERELDSGADDDPRDSCPYEGRVGLALGRYGEG